MTQGTHVVRQQHSHATETRILAAGGGSSVQEGCQDADSRLLLLNRRVHVVSRAAVTLRRHVVAAYATSSTCCDKAWETAGLCDGRAASGNDVLWSPDAGGRGTRRALAQATDVTGRNAACEGCSFDKITPDFTQSSPARMATRSQRRGNAYTSCLAVPNAPVLAASPPLPLRFLPPFWVQGRTGGTCTAWRRPPP